jgi:hypothetical protein
LGALWLLGNYIIKKAWEYLLSKRTEYIPDDIHIRFIDFVIFTLSLKWMNKTQWAALVASILMLIYHLLLLGDVYAAVILQSTAFLMELAIAPAFESTVKTMSSFIIRDGTKSTFVQVYKKYTTVFILFFMTTYFARLIILWQYAESFYVNLSPEEVGLGMTNMFYFTIFFGWLVALNAITSRKRKIVFFRKLIRKTLVAGRNWYAFSKPFNYGN